MRDYSILWTAPPCKNQGRRCDAASLGASFADKRPGQPLALPIKGFVFARWQARPHSIVLKESARLCSIDRHASSFILPKLRSVETALLFSRAAQKLLIIDQSNRRRPDATIAPEAIKNFNSTKKQAKTAAHKKLKQRIYYLGLAESIDK